MTIIRAVAALLGALLLAGCAEGTVARTSPPLEPALPHAATPTPGPRLGFTVALATPRPSLPRCLTPPASSPLRLPATGPWTRLDPASGLPQSRTIQLTAGRLPAHQQITAVWLAGDKSSSLSAIYWTDAHGTLTGLFHLPASAPGSYQVALFAGGTELAAASYRVVFHGTIRARILPDPAGERVTISGTCFLPGSRIALLAWRLLPPAKHQHPSHPLQLAVVTAGWNGTWQSSTTSHALPLGQYVIRAISLRGSALQLVDTYASVNA